MLASKSSIIGKPRRQRLNLLAVTVVSNEASSAAPLGPMLGQYQLPIAEFISAFNESCDLFSEETELPTFVLKSASPAFLFYIRRPSIKFIFYSFFDQAVPVNPVPLNLIYDLVKLVATYDTDGNFTKATKIVFSFLKSTKLTISL